RGERAHAVVVVEAEGALDLLGEATADVEELDDLPDGEGLVDGRGNVRHDAVDRGDGLLRLLLRRLLAEVEAALDGDRAKEAVAAIGDRVARARWDEDDLARADGSLEARDRDAAVAVEEVDDLLALVVLVVGGRLAGDELELPERLEVVGTPLEPELGV